ncbi:LamG-like jellyroll fold domain-containing protein [Streptomyces marianii]|uniref:LamG-like jellyroll fold domain-containing protein n=1 Tax=Streptomyces marianii TaxID=1817406 RepID=UPI001F30A564|nr:LamG-like jellyroll fold domain-containing protein [Streptomyces marianii]
MVTAHLGGDDGREFSARAGNYATSATDAAIPTVGPELAVRRTYNSLDPRTDTGFGTGWASRWDMRLREEVQTNTILVTLDSGSRIRFGINPDGTYAGPSGSTTTLKREVEGWVLRERSGTTYHFTSNGLVSQVKDAAGRAQTLRYRDEDGGPLESVTDVLSGRSLNFTWTGDHITSVATSAIGPTVPGLAWTYHYTGVSLTKVCSPASPTACTVYTYEDGSLYRSMVMDENPVAYWRLGEQEGSTGASQAPSRTGLNDAAYRDVLLGQPGAIAGTSDTAAGFDGTDSSAEIPENTLRTSTFLSVELWFKTTKPGVLLGFQGGDIDAGQPEYASPIAIDTAGRLRAQFEITGQPVTPMVSSKTVTDGAWHHVVLSGAGTTQTLYLDGAVVGSLTGPIDHYGKANAYLGAGWSSPAWDGQAAGVRHFDGTLDEAAVYHHALDAATVAAHYAARAKTPRMTKVVLPSGRTHATVAYDTASGRVTSTTDANGGVWKVSDPTYSSGSAAYQDAVMAQSPAGYWRLGERSGAQAVSVTGDGMDGSYRDGVNLGSPGVFADGDNTSIDLDGTEGAVNVPSDPLETTSTMSLELWFRTSKPESVLFGFQNSELGQTPTSITPALLIDRGGKLRGQLDKSQAGTTIASTTVVTDNEWHHVLLTGYSGGQAMYLDGVRVGTLPNPIKPITLPNAYLGGGYTTTPWDGQLAGTKYFSGQIDEAALYTTALGVGSAGQHYRARTALISGDGPHYRGAVTGDAPAGFWRLDEPEGATQAVSESAANDGAGTYTNATLATTGIFGVEDGHAAQFTGTGHIAVPSSLVTESTDVAVELWFRTTKQGVLLGLQNAPIGSTPTDARPVLNVGADGMLRGQFWTADQPNGATPMKSAVTVTDNEWHHAVLSASGSSQALYLDGIKVGTLNRAARHMPGVYAYLGAGYANTAWMGVTTAGTYRFTGQLDEVAVYQHGLTEDQVGAHYRARTRTSASGLASSIVVTDPAGHEVTTTYDALRGQRRTSTTDAEGGLTTYAYDTGGFLNTVTDPNGHSTITGHDARGNTVSRTTCRDADSCWTSFTEYYLNSADPLDPRNDKPVAVRDARSSKPADDRYKTTITYTSLGLPAATTLADGRTTTTAYTTGAEAAVGGGTTPAGLVATETTPGGAVTAYRYDAKGDLAQTTSASGLVTMYGYDGLGRKTSETQVSDAFPNGVTTTYTYDSLSKLVSETGAGLKNEITGTTHTAKITRTFDEDGNVLTEVMEDTSGGDPKSTTTYHYDQHGRNDTVTDGEGSVTAYGYDTLGRLAKETDALGNEQTYSYTALGNLAETVLRDWTGDPSGQVRDLVLESNAYDPAGRLASTTDAMGATTAYTYFDDGLPATTTAKQVSQSDGTRRDIVLEANTYDGAGHLTRQVTGGGTTTQVHTVDATGRVERTVLDPTGLNRRTDYLYDADDHVTEEAQWITDTKKRTERFTYDKAGNVLTAALSDGASTHTTRHTYDERGLQLSTVGPRGTVTGADPAAFTTSFRYDALGRLVERTAPPVAAEKYPGTAQTVRPVAAVGYNTFSDATDLRDENGEVTRSQFDKLGRATAVTLPAYTPPGATTPISAVARLDYDALGRTTGSTDPLGRVTRFAYDQLDNLVQQTDPAPGAPTGLQEPSPFSGTSIALDGGGITRYTWTPTGLQLSATTPTGARTEATWDELGRQLTATTVERYPSLQNLTSRYTWDDAGNQIVATTPAGRMSTAVYNKAGEPVSTTEPGGGVTTFAYDGLGRVIETTDPTRRKSTVAFDALDNVTEAADHGTGTTVLRSAKATYDAEGNQLTATSPTGGHTEFGYDALGRMTTQKEKVSGTRTITTSFGYDTAGNRTRFTDGRAMATYYTFNSWGLPESTIEPATTQHWNEDVRTWTTVYDAAGQPVTERLPGDVIRQRTYDGLGRLVKESGSGTAVSTRPRSLSYDLDGRLTAVGTDAVSGSNTYTYNDRGQLLSTQGPAGQSRYDYDADGSMTSRTDAAGSASFGYDESGRLDWANDPLSGTQIWFDFDAAGRPRLEQYARPDKDGLYTVGAKRSFGYDSLGRLTTDTVARTSGGTEVTGITYAYDLADRLVNKTTTGTAGAGTHTYTYDLIGRTTSWTSGSATVPYEWDDAGNLTKKGDITGTYDSRNRLVTWGQDTFAYSARGTEKLITEGDGSTRTINSDAFERTTDNGTSTFTYDSLDRVMTHNGTAFTYDGGSNSLVSDTTTTYTRRPDGSLLSSATTGTPNTARLSITDRHTDLVASLSPDGTTLAGSRAYDPFGTVTAADGNNPAVGYQSGWTDTGTGEVNMAARWYQPGTGGFTSRDTWQLDPTPSGQANRYAYAGGEPLNGTDPTGHLCVCGRGYGGFGTASSSMGGVRGGGYRGTAPARSQAKSRPKARTATSTRSQSWDSCNRNRCGNNRTTPTRRPATSSRPATRATTSRTWSNRSGSSRCTYGTCGRNPTTRPTPNRGTHTSGSGRPSTPTRPSKPPTPQNPNRGKHPQPAPTRPAPKPRVDVAATTRQALDTALVYDRALFIEMASHSSGRYTPADQAGLELLQDMFPEHQLDPDLGYGTSGADPHAKRTRNSCSRDLPSKDPSFFYSPMTRFGPDPEDCRATGAVAHLDAFDLRPWRLDPKWKPAGYNDLPASNRAALHLIANQMGGARDTLRNFVAGYQDPANSPHMRGLENKITRAIKDGEMVTLGVLPVYGGTNPAIPNEIKMYAVGNKGYRLACTVHNRPAGGYSCSEGP